MNPTCCMAPQKTVLIMNLRLFLGLQAEAAAAAARYLGRLQASHAQLLESLAQRAAADAAALEAAHNAK